MKNVAKPSAEKCPGRGWLEALQQLLQLLESLQAATTAAGRRICRLAAKWMETGWSAVQRMTVGCSDRVFVGCRLFGGGGAEGDLRGGCAAAAGVISG